jgi:hypothetical protein
MNIKGFIGAAVGGLLLVGLLLTFGISCSPGQAPGIIGREAIAMQEAKTQATATAVAIQSQAAQDTNQQPVRSAVSDVWLVMPALPPAGRLCQPPLGARLERVHHQLAQAAAPHLPATR